MLGRMRRTTRKDVGLSLTFTGLVFLTWSFVTFAAKYLFERLVLDSRLPTTETLSPFTLSVKRFFLDYGFGPASGKELCEGESSRGACEDDRAEYYPCAHAKGRGFLVAVL